jgi:nicotinate-nucleotide adenylyltransferase
VSQKRIGLFGGLFDPVHNGHLRLARAALSNLSLDNLIIMPAGTPGHKQDPLLPAQERLSLLQKAFVDTPGVTVSDEEIRRKGVSYTWETLARIREGFTGVLYLVIGADNIGEIRKWRHPERILEMARIAVAARPPYPSLEFFPEYAGRMESLPVEPLEISSTELRRRLKAGEDAGAFIPQKALEMILEKGWYR